MIDKRNEGTYEGSDSRKSPLTYGELLQKLAESPNPIFNDDEIKDEYDPNRR
jgi:hypothetical protein